MRARTLAVGSLCVALACESADSQNGTPATGGTGAAAAGSGTGGGSGAGSGGTAGSSMAGSGALSGTNTGGGGSDSGAAGEGGAGAGGTGCDDCRDGRTCHDELGCVRVCSASVIITSEMELDEFAALGCQVLEGSLTIESPTLTNLDALPTRTLVFVTGELAIQQNQALVDARGLLGLERVGSLVITDNPLLANLSGLDDLDILGSDPGSSFLVISANAELTSIAELATVSRLSASVLVSDNPMLESLSGLAGLTIGSGVTVTGNEQLNRFAALEELESVETLTVAANPSLESLELPALTEGGSITITTNAALQSIDLTALASAGSLTIASNLLLSSMGTLDALTEVDSLVIAGNPMLPQCFVDALDTRLQACTACQGNDLTATCN